MIKANGSRKINMAKYISILRGINVSGQNKIVMKDLKSLYENLGFDNVVTYIQSGNVIFDTKFDDIQIIQKTIMDAIKSKFNFEVPVDARTAIAFKDVLAQLPFNDINLEKDGTKVLVTFLRDQPEIDKLDALLTFVKPPEKLIFGDKCIYLYCPNGYGKTKLSNVFIEKKLNVSATTRNLKSINKLCELAN